MFLSDRAGIDAGLMHESPFGGIELTQLGRFWITARAGLGDDESALECHAQFLAMLDDAVAGGFRASGELTALLTFGVDLVHSPRLLELCRQAVDSIGGGAHEPAL